MRKFTKNNSIFLKLIDTVSAGDMCLKKSIQELYGVLLCDYDWNNIIVNFTMIWRKGSRGIILKDLLEALIGKEKCTYTNLPEIVCMDFFGKKIETLNKSLDVMQKDLYRLNMFDLSLCLNEDKYYKKKVFVGQNFIGFIEMEKPRCWTYLLLDYDLSQEYQDNDFMLEKLLEEKDLIFNWAQEGLKRLLKNNGEFTKSTGMIESIPSNYKIL